VAGYPEKHPEAPNFDSDIRYLKMKVDAGASYVVTQMFFDNKHYFAFVERCRQEGINVPIVPGLKPVAIKQHLSILPRTFGIDLPDELVREIENCSNNQQVRQVGIEWAVKQTKELIAAKVPAVHFYTMGRSDNVYQIARQCF
jgi:methylenetetrahydrofolate reductase (NADPH)